MQLKTKNLQLSHPTNQKLVSLLKDTNVDDKELMAKINVSNNCEIGFEHKKPKPKPVAGIPLAKQFQIYGSFVWSLIWQNSAHPK